jgi:hypothetical protein
MGDKFMGMPVSNYSFFHSLSQRFYKKNNNELFNAQGYYAGNPKMKELTDRVLNPYKIFAFIIHDPSRHQEFANTLKAEFINFHFLTGNNLLFFALTEAPEEWDDERIQPGYFGHLNKIFEEQRDLYPYFRSYRANMDDNHFSAQAFAQMLNIPYDQLPVIVVTHHPTLDDYRWYRTCNDQIQNQLGKLTVISNLMRGLHDNVNNFKDGQKEFFNLMDKPNNNLDLCSGKGEVLLNESLATAISELMSFIIIREQNDTETINLAKSQVEMAINRVYEAIRVTKKELNENDLESAKLNEILENLSAKIGYFLTYLQQYQKKKWNVEIQGFELDSNQLLKLGTNIFMYLKTNERYFPYMDFTPSAICLAKAFEIEINKSIVHWIRKQNNITLPQYFYKVQPEINVEITPNIDKGIPIDFNKSKKNGSWQPPAMGQSYLIASKNIGKSEWEPFFTLKERKTLLKEWDRIVNLRNRAAHTDKLTNESVEELIESIKFLRDENIIIKLGFMRDSFQHNENVN